MYIHTNQPTLEEWLASSAEGGGIGWVRTGDRYKSIFKILHV